MADKTLLHLRRPGLGLAFFLVLLVALPAAAAAQCGDVIYRIWQSNRETFYDFGQEITLATGETVHLYLHHRSRSPSPYGTSAEIGYPAAFGFSAFPSDEVRRHVEMRQQSADDVADGRVIFKTLAPGTTALGYKITRVAKAGVYDDLAERCRTGMVKIRVTATATATPPPPTVVPVPPPASAGGAEAAARQLVTLLYEGLMRRPSAGSFPQSQVDQVRQEGHAGLVRLAEEMARSEEFRTQVLARTAAAHPNVGSDQDAAKVQLVEDVYRSLYGRASIPVRAHQANLQHLSTCLSPQGGLDACDEFGRAIVDDPFFFEQHRTLLQQLPDGDL